MKKEMTNGEIIERLSREAERKTILIEERDKTIEALNKRIAELETELADLKGQN